MAQIRIDDEVYARLKEAADFNKRTVGQHILFLLDNEITFNDIRGMLKNKTENPEKNRFASEQEKPNGEHIGRREVKSKPQLIEEINLIKARYAEEAEFCQDQEQLNNLNKNMNAEIQPLQAQIDSMV